ncbi:general transcriptional corepressor trfA-like isoform X2 [Aethina tumida]|nr:general transcriptional corepressor trfA-like isoform X2 [Aethina tumida]XP_049822793.1 general transcriptional corepressor trfA-like isoform X2 [Aethina tumida]
MRLKNADGPLSVHNNVNNDILNSPKRINTLQNSNILTSNCNNTTSNLTSNDVTTTNYTINTEDLNTLNNVTNVPQDQVQWCNPAHRANKRELINNTNNRNQLLNINNTLAASIRNSRHGTVSSIYSVSSPDDSLLDYEDAHQSGSSVEASPQEEERVFDVSDSESSDEGNDVTRRRGCTLQRRGIVNPNYPGFQHLAHTLDYTIKASSDTDFTDDDLDSDLPINAQVDTNSLNNNNNSVADDTEFPLDHIDSVNRLDSVENIQKVFYDKPVFNLEDCENLNSNTQATDEVPTIENIDLNIKIEEHISQSATHENIVGDFGKEVEQELGKISLDNQTVDDYSGPPYPDPYELLELEKAVILELEEAVEKLAVLTDLKPSATKYNIEPNIEQPFNKLSPSKQIPVPVVLEDSEVIKAADMASIQTQAIETKEFENEPVDLNTKMTDAFLSNAQEDLSEIVKENIYVDSNLNIQEPVKMDVDASPKKPELTRRDSNRELEEIECQIKKIKSDTQQHMNVEDMEKFCKENITKDYKEKDEDSAVPRKKEKIDYFVKKRRDYNQQFGSLITFPRREVGSRNRDPINRRSVPMARDKKKSSTESLGSFDVYNIETAMPKIDLEAIECHLRAAREEERRRRTDREEIRRRLAMGSEEDYYTDRPGRKPSLQARLQSGMNLQICFMNETVSDTESPSSDSECPMTNPKQPKTSPKNTNSNSLYKQNNTPAPATRPATLNISQPLLQPIKEPMTETDFFARQARLQTEARMALAQAKEMARMQMEIERQKQKKSPITEMVRHSLEKVGIPFPEEKRRLSRQILTEMNVAQLQVIVNDLHTQIETLNENLVKFLMDRDDLHMEQDSMLVDIEDLTRYLGAKEQVYKEQTLAPTQNNNISPPSPAPSSPLAALNSSVKPHLHRIASLVKK